MPVIGYLDATSPAEGIVALRRGLSESGFVEGRNVFPARLCEPGFVSVNRLGDRLVARAAV